MVILLKVMKCKKSLTKTSFYFFTFINN